MLRKYITYPVLLIIFISFVGFILFGSLLRHHYLGGDRLKSLQKIAVFFAEIPSNAKNMFKRKTVNISAPKKFKRHKDKERFIQHINNKRNALLVLPRYDHSIKRSIIDIIDLNNFEVIHSYKHDIAEMLNQVTNEEEFSTFKIDNSPIRFLYVHPLLLNDGSVISGDHYSIKFKIDFCSNLIWINDEERYHHSQEIDHEGNIWIGGQMKPKSKLVKTYSAKKNYYDDSIVKININGKILFNKSITEILLENKIMDRNVFDTFVTDPIHVNDIEPAFNDTPYWKKGDIFISIRHQSSIIHYRPSTNKVINYLIGPFSQQHDVDIISEKEISIFNNNNFLVDNSYSEILVYNFETNTYKKLFEKDLQKEEFKTPTEGLSHIFDDGALMVEEQNHGRIILFNNLGEKEWEFVNKDSNGDVGPITWSRIIENELFIKKFRTLVENEKCIN